MTIAVGSAPVRAINGATVPSVANPPAVLVTRAEARKLASATRKPVTRKRPLPLAKRQAQAEKVARWVGIGATAVVWLGALIVSYAHISGLAIRHGQSWSAGHLYPLIIDGLMIVASVATMAHRNARMPKVIFGFGAACTVAANFASVQHADKVGYACAGVVGVSLVASAYLLERLCLPQPPKPRKPASKRK